jgi:hypothetical protein
MGLCDRVGICSQNRTKVRLLMHVVALMQSPDMFSSLVQLQAITLDNASSNGKLCQTVQQLHQIRGLPEWNAHENQLM